MNRSGAIKRNMIVFAIILTAALVFLARPVSAAQAVPIPNINVGVGNADNPAEMSASLQILFLLTILSLAPSILIMMTSFTRIIIVLSFMRSALATQHAPPNQIIIGMALFLTFFVMAPTWSQINQNALQPYMEEKIDQEQALGNAVKPLREFMFKQTREKDLALFVKLSENPRPKTYDDVPTMVLIPSFVLSEMKTAFQIGFMLFIPFIVIDMIVASSLMSMGMIMLPPMMISMPFKILLFVMVDGWYLLTRSLVLSFQ
ncbi:flagellar type III secretion system pore protein FliP [Phosphitispora fastidiosa]|uniref:flagellar type III secretion system pore protein FliP n=1 Tax=Phosphitispora fastidiosa TaxID=2837202 RepID=UPI001E5A6D2A|nr:flagellar type III secretion system pore protein FliP [Phosphitispora fastidiosa]MBU7008280.1 flagellar biosynthetic protein FliP [Phosphitispora fastidiosa]